MSNLNTNIKPDYSEAIAKFVANGGVIQQAENTNKADFNYFDADAAEKNKEKPNSSANHELRQKAEAKGLKKYSAYAPCKSCQTSIRSVATNACLECDRRRARKKFGVNARSLDQIGEYLLKQDKSHTFVSGGKTYTLKVEPV